VAFFPQRIGLSKESSPFFFLVDLKRRDRPFSVSSPRDGTFPPNERLGLRNWAQASPHSQSFFFLLNSLKKGTGFFPLLSNSQGEKTFSPFFFERWPFPFKDNKDLYAISSQIVRFLLESLFSPPCAARAGGSFFSFPLIKCGSFSTY